jgi:hypothetical protein
MSLYSEKSMVQPDLAALKARNKLLVLFILLFVLDITLVILSRDLWAIGRILVTIWVMYWVMQGRKWAKWLLMGICSLLVVALIAMVIALRSKLSMILIVGSLIMAIISAIIPIYMAKSDNLNRYFHHKRQALPQ